MDSRVKDDVGDLAAGVGKQNLFCQSHTDERDAAGELRARVGSHGKLVGDLGETNDRAGDELGKHRHVAREVDEVAKRPGVATIHIDRVAHRLERVKADPKGQDHADGPVESQLGHS